MKSSKVPFMKYNNKKNLVSRSRLDEGPVWEFHEFHRLHIFYFSERKKPESDVKRNPLPVSVFIKLNITAGLNPSSDAPQTSTRLPASTKENPRPPRARLS